MSKPFKSSYHGVLFKATKAETLAELLKKASLAHHDYEQRSGKPDAYWPLWYAEFLLNNGLEHVEFRQPTSTPLFESPAHTKPIGGYAE